MTPTRRTRGRRRGRGPGVLSALFFVTVIGTVGTLAVWDLFVLRVADLRDPDEVRTLSVPLPDGSKRQLVVGPANPYWTPLEVISPEVRRCVVRAEDARFFSHPGFDWEELRNSIERNWQEQSYRRGGSTITMQLAKNLFLWREKSLLRKALEAYLTIRLEMTLTKNRILELYLNVVEWGPGIYGIGEASFHYFGERPRLLGTDEAALLASILPNPVDWSPDRSPATAWQRKRDLLERLGGSC